MYTIDPRSYDHIELNIPYKFGRTQEEYVISNDLSTFPRTTIFRLEKDLGPISKMLPTLERCSRPTIIISIDDDTIYDRELVFLLLRVLRLVNYECVIGFQGFTPDLKNKFEMSPETLQKANYHSSILGQHSIEAKPVTVIEGFGAIAYFSPLVDTNRLRSIS